jgi:hypothetical protein
MAALGSPLLGDPLYGRPQEHRRVPRLWLHAWRVDLDPALAASLESPRAIECPLWDDLAAHLLELGIDPGRILR